jgi:DNA-binding LytR/AlgR family response regulator
MTTLSNILNYNEDTRTLILVSEDMVFSAVIDNLTHIYITKDHQIIITGNNKEFRINKPTSECLTAIFSLGFFQVHPQFLVNPTKINLSLSNEVEITLENGRKIPTQERYFKNLLKMINV